MLKKYTVTHLKSFYTDYFIKLDLVNKYSITNIFLLSSIEKIILSFKFSDLVLSYTNSSALKDNSQIKAFLIFYVYLSLISLIKFEKNKSTSSTLPNNNLVLKIILINKKDINYFLYNLFIENQYKFKITEKEFLQNFLKSDKNFNIRVFIPSFLFFDLNNFFTLNINNINLQNLKIQTNFVFKKGEYNSFLYFKNLLFYGNF